MFHALGDLAASAFPLVRAGAGGGQQVGVRASLRGANGGKQDSQDEMVIQTMLGDMGLDVWITTNLSPAWEGHYLSVAKATFEGIESILALGLNLTDDVQREIIRTGGRRVGMVDIEGQARQSLFTALSEGRALGEGPPALARRIRDQVAAGRFETPAKRASVIARTETKYAQNVSSLQAYRGSRAVTGLRAFDNQTGFGDAECEARNQQIYTFDEADQETASEHPNGTLSWAPVVREVE